MLPELMNKILMNKYAIQKLYSMTREQELKWRQIVF